MNPRASSGEFTPKTHPLNPPLFPREGEAEGGGGFIKMRTTNPQRRIKMIIILQTATPGSAIHLITGIFVEFSLFRLFVFAFIKEVDSFSRILSAKNQDN